MARDGNQIIRLTAEISCDKSKVLGEGSFACVFPGTIGNCKVAIKRIQNENFNSLEDTAMKTLDHPNVLKFYDLIEDSNFK
jgi:serine/threonine protein kinase